MISHFTNILLVFKEVCYFLLEVELITSFKKKVFQVKNNNNNWIVLIIIIINTYWIVFGFDKLTKSLQTFPYIFDTYFPQ